MLDEGKKRALLAFRFIRMSFEKLVEEKIREAMAEGEFDNLPGKGKPLNLDEYFATPEDLRITYSVLKNAGVIPEPAQLLTEIASLKRELERFAREDERASIKRRIEETILKKNLSVEHYKRRR